MRHRQASKTTHYHYTAHRLDSVTYDDALSTVYHYNAYGQPDSVYDESGVMCYEYGNMGEVTKETRIYALPFLSQPLALSTLFEYDSWGRILNITYPDNEIVNYDYDLGGQLERMYNNSSYTYLDNIIYDRFGAKTSQDYGNGIVTQYTYNDTTRRLTDILTSNNFSLHYTYDLVGNVTQVSSICPWLQNQNFTETFTYDSTDQLISANETQSYRLAVNYGNWGKIMQYDLTQTDMLNNATSQISRSLTYPSHANNVGNSQTPFAPTMQNGDEDVFFTFGINGSLRKREVQTPNPHTEYYLFNSQGNLKAYSDDVMSFAYYGYNAANTRTYKISLYNTNLWINGQQQPIQPMVQSAMFYPNTYINFTQAGEYTKHYYNGTERIASRLGEQQVPVSVENDQELEAYKQDVKQIIYNAIGQHLYDEPTDMQEGDVFHLEFLQPCGDNNAVYYYHPNHLGSTSFVTDMQQSVVQNFLYAPYGEIISEYNTHAMGDAFPKYAFNAKELDEETGMYYYEARYYAPPTFTSRDPLFEKYFWISPYAYCANNPVKYVDPSGDSIDVSGLSNEQLEIYKNSINELKNSPLFAYYYRGLHNSSTKYTIQAGPGYGGSGSFDSETNTISANLNNLYSLSQEMFHAYQQDCAFYTSDDGSVRETEGDLMAMLVLTDISKYSISFGVEWAIPFNDYLYDEYRESFFDKEFVNVFDHLVDERIKYYLTTKDPPETYIQPNSHKSPQALLNVLKNVSYQYQQWKSNPKSRPNLGIIVTGKKINK